MEQERFEAYLRSFQPEVPRQLQQRIFAMRTVWPWIIYLGSIAATVMIAISVWFYLRPRQPQLPLASPLRFTSIKKYSLGYWRLQISNDTELEALKTSSATIFPGQQKQNPLYTIRKKL